MRPFVFRTAAWRRALATSALLVVMLSASCYRQAAEQPRQESRSGPIRIGSVLFLTGPAASYGAMQRSAFEIGRDEINSSGGIDGHPLEIIYEDSEHSEPKAVAAVKKLIGVDKVPMILEVTGSGEALASAPVAQSSRIVLLSAIDSSPKLTESGSYFFRIMPSDLFQGRFLSDWGHAMNWKKAAILFVNNDWGVGMRDSVTASFTKAGGTIALTESSADEDLDFRTQFAKIKAAKPDGVFLLLYPQAAGRALKQAKELGVRGPFLGGDALSGSEVGATAGAASDGLMFCQPSKGSGPVFDAFRKKYLDRFHDEPSVYSIKSYDAVKIAGEALRHKGPTTEGVREYLDHLQNYRGASGIISLDANGDIVTQEYDKYVYRSGKFERMN